MNEQLHRHKGLDIMDMYCCGFNGFGQLGTSSPCSDFTWFQFQNVTDVMFSFSSAVIFSGDGVLISGLVGEKDNQLRKLEPPGKGKFLQASCSSRQVLFVTVEGECWQYLPRTESWKKLPDFSTVENEEVGPRDDSLPKNTSDYGVLEFKKVPNQIIKVSCGDVLSIALDAFGRVYSIPSPLDLDRVKVVDVACGFEHCVLLDEAGVVYTWGSGTRGQLGHGETEFQDLPPRKVETFCGLKVIKISAGGWHSAAVTEMGDLYTWGWNNIGQLGFPMTKSNLRSANQYKKTSEEIDKEYAMSLQHVSNQLAHKTVHSNVEGEEGTLTEVSERKSKRTKHSLSSDVSESSVENLKCLLESRGDNSAIIASDGESSVDREDCSSRTAVSVAVLSEPWPVDFPLGIDVNVVDVSCGNRHTVVLLDDGSVWGCGWNAYNQLGRPSHTLLYSSQMTKIPLPCDMKINTPVSVRCGAWNTAILVMSQDIH
ncbi:uncharacterized protein [Anabrus simplex]|uniref:uncharacterized protein n=1 Tax=Anabrus simplex TaxID=316456 RepID=UPI0035A3C13D